MQPLLELKDLYFSVLERNIINKVSLTVFPGDFVVILGGNGSGKSSLLKLINRTHERTRGDLHHPLIQLENDVVTLTQFTTNSLFMDLSVAENAYLIASTFDCTTRKKQLLSELPTYLKRFNPALSAMLSTPVKNLSGGEQQVLAFALYLKHHPKILLLDEHTSALDPNKSKQIMVLTHEIIQEKKITCLMTTHNLDYALRYGNRLVALRRGEIIFEATGAEKHRLTHQDLLAFCY